jgi:hypothetical protein
MPNITDLTPVETEAVQEIHLQKPSAEVVRLPIVFSIPEVVEKTKLARTLIYQASVTAT